ncbi:MAG: hypothetical protein M1838_005398 [Thelocarpon superellum]|nr:MAG: hypothetical protein M1838_005398 [Thelocarpon superellum]
MAPIVAEISSLFHPDVAAAASTSDKGQFERYLADLGLATRDGVVGRVSADTDGILSKRTAAPSTLSHLTLLPRELAPRAATPHNPSSGSINPYNVNNNGIFALFGLLGAGLVLTGIWFFFWAKNGGFVFRKGDWDDYKSTVLRRKDRNGKTLSNATRSTNLGQGSIAGEYDRDDVPLKRGAAGIGGAGAAAAKRDTTVREYRHEKPARVGGLNRKPDGSYYEHAATSDMSDSAATPPAKAKAPRKSFFSRDKTATPAAKLAKAAKNNKPSLGSNAKPSMRQVPRQPSTTYSFTNGDEDDLSTLPDAAPPPRHSYRHSGNAPHAHAHAHGHAKRASNHYRDDVYSESGTGTSYGYGYGSDADETGTKAYSHHIPGLGGAYAGSGSMPGAWDTPGRGTGAGKARTDDSFSRGERRGKAGYRRGEGLPRRDSLSDSD